MSPSRFSTLPPISPRIPGVRLVSDISPTANGHAAQVSLYGGPKCGSDNGKFQAPPHYCPTALTKQKFDSHASGDDSYGMTYNRSSSL
jgi:hypothetical protein